MKFDGVNDNVQKLNTFDEITIVYTSKYSAVSYQ
jgi:hypothetical protein